MRVICRASDRNWNNPQVLGRANEVSPELRLQFRRNLVFSFAGRKDAVEIIRRIGVRHIEIVTQPRRHASDFACNRSSRFQIRKEVPSLAGLMVPEPTSPALTCWAS